MKSCITFGVPCVPGVQALTIHDTRIGAGEEFPYAKNGLTITLCLRRGLFNMVTTKTPNADSVRLSELTTMVIIAQKIADGLPQKNKPRTEGLQDNHFRDPTKKEKTNE